MADLRGILLVYDARVLDSGDFDVDAATGRQQLSSFCEQPDWIGNMLENVAQYNQVELTNAPR